MKFLREAMTILFMLLKKTGGAALRGGGLCRIGVAIGRWGYRPAGLKRNGQQERCNYDAQIRVQSTMGRPLRRGSFGGNARH